MVLPTTLAVLRQTVGRRLEISVTQEAGVPPPAAVVVVNHQRDLDPVVWGLWLAAAARRVLFVTRQDAFQRGYLASQVMPQAPSWLAAILRHVNTGIVARWVHAVPITQPGPPTLAQVIRLASRLWPGITTGQVLHRLPGEPPTGWEAVPVRQWLSRLSPAHLGTPLSWSSLRSERRRELIHLWLADFGRQISGLATAVDRGGTAVVAVEGRLSPDGHFGPAHAVLNRLAAAVDRPLAVIPAAVTYDHAVPGRLRTAVRSGPPFLVATDDRAAATARRVGDAVRRCLTAHLTQLAGHELCAAGAVGITVQHLGQQVVDLAGHLAAAGAPLDPVLQNPDDVRHRLDLWVGQVMTSGTVSRQADRLFYQVPAAGRGWRHDPVGYGARELDDILAVHAGVPGLPLPSLP